jgi:KTSC domain
MDEVGALLHSLIQQAAEMADQFSEEEMAEILTIFEKAIAYVQSQDMQAQIGAKPDNLPSADYPSSNVHGFHYTPENQELQVQFHGPYPNAEGSIYSYSGVPEFIFNILEKGSIAPKTSGKNRYHEWRKGVTPSLGAAVNALLKAGGFQYTKLS